MTRNGQDRGGRVPRRGSVGRSAILLIAGVVLAAAGILVWSRTEPVDTSLMQTRAIEISDVLRTLRTGGPPLLACTGAYDAAAPLATCRPAGITDDQGIYFYLPYFAIATGIEDPQAAQFAFEIVFFALLVLIYPIVFWMLFNSLVAAIAVTVILTVTVRSFLSADIYWISAWLYLLTLPLLALVFSRWARWGGWAIAALMVIVLTASFATSIRVGIGLPILVGATIVVILRRSSWVQVGTTALVLVISYLSIQGWLFEAVRLTRDTEVGVPLSEQYPSEHPLWHNAYLGLGYLPNQYNISWDDQVAIDAVKRLLPSAVYPNEAYERALRDEYLRIAIEDPWLVVGNVLAKFGAILANRSVGLMFAFLPLLVFLGRINSRMGRFLLIALPAFVLSLVPPLLTQPIFSYFSGWAAVLASVWFLGVAWLIAVGPRARTWFRDVRQQVQGTGFRPAISRARSIGGVAIRAPVTRVTAITVIATAVFVYVVTPRIVAAF